MPARPPTVTAGVANQHPSLLAAERFFWAVSNNDLAYLKKLNPEHRQSRVNAIHRPSGLTPLMLAIKSRNADMAQWLIRQGASLDLLCVRETSALMYAAKRADREMMELLLTEGAPIEQTDAERRTALHHAAMQGKVEAVALLLDCGAALEKQDAQGNTALLFAVSGNHAAVVALLVERGANAAHVNREGAFPLYLIPSKAVAAALLKKPINLQQATASGLTALMRQALDGACEIALLLLDHGADVNFANRFGHTALHMAIHKKQHAMMKLLLGRNADPGCIVPEPQGAKKWGLLSLAARVNDIRAMELLIEAGADIDGCKEETAPPLCHAAVVASKQTVAWLLDKKANVNATSSSGMTALIAASHRGEVEIAELLLQHQAAPDAVDAQKLSALHMAALAGHNPCIVLLLKNGVCLQQKDAKGRLPLHLAANQGHETTIKLLLDHKVDIDQTDSHGWTALMHAAQSGRLPAVKFLLSQNADSNAQNAGGNNALHVAAVAGKDEVVAQLTRQPQIDIDCKNKEGKTALFLAARYGHNDAVHRLLDNGADPCEANNLGFNSLHIAAFHGHVAVIETLLASNHDKDFLHCLNNDGFTPLSCAAQEGKLDAVRVLLENGADPDVRGKRGVTALNAAARAGHAKVVQLLLTTMKPPLQLPGHQPVLSLSIIEALDLALDGKKASVVEVVLRSYPYAASKRFKWHVSPVIADLRSYVHLVTKPEQGEQEQSREFAGRSDIVNRLAMLLQLSAAANDNATNLWTDWLGPIPSCATIAEKVKELCTGIVSVKHVLAGSEQEITPAQNTLVCAGILTSLNEASIFSAPYSAKDLSPEVEACFNQLALHQAHLLAQAGEEAEQPLVIALGDLHGTCMNSFAGKRFHQVTLYMYLTRKCGVYDIPAKRISDAFAEIWPQHEHSGTAVRERAFAQALATRSNSREALEPIAHDSAQAGNAVTFHWLLNRQLDLVNAWHKKVLETAVQ